jgi:cytochrome c biogenesis factor
LRRHLVWTPDAVGSLAFLISGVLAVAALTVDSVRRDRLTAWLNMVGCLAFGVSAAAAFVRRSGVTEDAWLANLGTFIGALCFLAAALLGLPRFREPGRSLRQFAA